MDYVTRQFINLTKKFRKELRKMLTALRDALNKQTEAIRQSNAGKEEQSPRPEIVARVNLPESIEVHQNADDAGRERRYKNRTLMVNSFTLAAVVVYALLVYLQYREMINATGAAQQAVVEARRNRIQADKSLNATIQQFRLDQRAWVGVVSIDPPDLKPKSEFFLSLHAMNSGHTPALNFQSLVVLHSLKKDEKFKAIYAPLPPNWVRSNRVVQPGEQVTLNTNRYQLTQGQIDWIKNGTYILYVYGKMSYDDVFHEQHYTTFCKIVISEALVEDCGTYNTAD